MRDRNEDIKPIEHVMLRMMIANGGIFAGIVSSYIEGWVGLENPQSNAGKMTKNIMHNTSVAMGVFASALVTNVHGSPPTIADVARAGVAAFACDSIITHANAVRRQQVMQQQGMQQHR